MITVDFGEKVQAECKFDYSGPSGYFTFALEIGTWIGPVGPFNTLDRWETTNIYVSPGTGKIQTLVFTIAAVSGLNRGTVYDMNWEIGKGSKADGTWSFITRKITDDIIKISELVPMFSNLVVTYKKV